MEYPKRKNPRLPEFAYSEATYYFITVCTKDRARTLGRVTEKGKTDLTAAGKSAECGLLSLGEHYPGAQVHVYVIMPDHVHFILSLGCGDDLSAPCRTTLARVMSGWKAGVSREAKFPVWQRSYYDHVIRNRQDFQEIWKYIENNPRQWVLDGKG